MARASSKRTGLLRIQISLKTVGTFSARCCLSVWTSRSRLQVVHLQLTKCRCCFVWTRVQNACTQQAEKRFWNISDLNFRSRSNRTAETAYGRYVQNHRPAHRRNQVLRSAFQKLKTQSESSGKKTTPSWSDVDWILVFGSQRKQDLKAWIQHLLWRKRSGWVVASTRLCSASETAQNVKTETAFFCVCACVEGCLKRCLVFKAQARRVN